MRRYVAIFAMSVATLSVSLPAHAATEWEVKITNLTFTTSGSNVTSISGKVVSRNFVCRFTGPMEAYYVPTGAAFHSGYVDANETFTINGNGPLGQYKVVRPRSTHSGDNGKKHVCLKAVKKINIQI